MKKSFILHNDSLVVVNELTTEQKGELFQAIVDYHSGKEVQLTGLMKVVFIPFKNQFERDAEKYESIRERNANNIKERWNKDDTKNTTGKNGIPEIPDDTKNTDSDSDSDSVNDNDSKKENPSFEDFWNSYDKKVDRKESERKWNKLTQADKEAIMEFIPKYKKFNPDKQFRKHPDSFIFNRTWEDELIQKNGHEEPATVAKGWH